MGRSGGGSSGKDKYKDAPDAKHLFDIIGKDVHEKAENEAKQRSNGDLKAYVSFATFSGVELSAFTDPCKLIKDKGDKLLGASGERNPCGNVSASEKRFSVKEQAEYDNKKMKCSNGDACAPFRRLHLCDKNMVKMDTNNDSKAKHNLLLDVCLAAKYEGESLEKYRAQYEAKYEDYGSTICTILARSFADIGDIIRGKDLYLGDKKKKQTERDQLESKLKKIFKQIHGGLTGGVKARYTNDGDNYFQLREDWWEANRHQVWKAITCEAPNDAQYFRGTCGGENIASLTDVQCRCRDDRVPTYFDYVPQYLRWFEEWAEDFCRKRKHKLQNAIKNCRGMGDNDNKRYCSGNGYDCTKTVRAKEKYSMENNCPRCFFACSPFVKWLDNQKVEFHKQKEKYTQEMEKYKNGTKQATNGTTNNLYVKDFYDELRTKYGTVNAFLALLSEEKICKDPPEASGETADAANFTNENTEKTFCRTKICEPCPECGVKCDSKECTAYPVDKDCPSIFQIYEPNPDDPYSDIKILKSGEGHKDIEKKLNEFCKNSNDNSSLYEEWKCYHDKEGKDKCILQYDEQGKSKKKVKEFYDFFRFWVTHMLNDSMEWRNKLKKCLENNNGNRCRKGCNSNCECFKNWVEEKKKEWGQIKRHFDTQEGFGKGTAYGPFGHYLVLEQFLELEFLTGISEVYNDPEHMKKIKKKLDEKKKERDEDASKKETIIDYLLEHEGDDANNCLKTHKKDKCDEPQQSAEEGVAKSGEPPAQEVDSSGEEDEENTSDVEDDVVDTTEDTDGSAPQVPPQQEGSTTTTQNDVKVCDIVGGILTKDNLTQACEQKYDGKYYGWKCVTPSGAETAPSSDSGSICVPPRRRRLYIQKLHNWATNMEATQTSGTSSPSGKESSPSDKLRNAFIQSAAIETFFLWHRYKKIKLKEKLEEQARQNAGLASTLGGSVDGDSNDPQNTLLRGEIPPDFLRQMFYTLADYRDILEGKNDILIQKTSSGSDKEMQEREKQIKDAIDNYFSKSDKTPQQTWWDTHGPDIWKGMICALTYTDSEQKVDDAKPQQNESVRKAFFGDKDNPGTTSGTPVAKTSGTTNGTYEKTYKYDQVKLDENSGPGSSSTQSSPSSGDNTPLTQFVQRPPYFRYLEEWGETFCRQRTRMLKQVEKNCTQHGEKQYSGDGEDCTQMLRDDPSNFPDLGSSCPKSCSFYKKWIERKKIEFHKQSNAYKQQKEDAQKNNNNGFCGTVTTCDTAADFLNRLKSGPCKNDNIGGKIEFKEQSETFKHTEKCDPCPEFKINCRNGNCKGDTENECNGKTAITAKDIEEKTDANGTIEMLVSDNNSTDFPSDLDNVCKGKGIFTGIRKDQWKCRNVCGYVVCKPEKDSGKNVKLQNGNDKHIITIRALLHRWLEYFLEDYNKIRKKLKPCMYDGERSKCIKDCVGKWVEIKKEEWGKIKNRLVEQYKSENVYYNVKSSLEKFEHRPEFKNAIKPCDDLDKFQESKECAVTENAGNGKPEKKDVVLCLLENLKTKATSCPSKPSDNQKQEQCQHPVLDEEPLEEDENTVEAPKICPSSVEETKKVVEEDACKRAEEPTEESSTENSGDSNTEDTPTIKPVEPPRPAPAPAASPSPVPPNQSDQPTNSISDILSSTIPFGIAIALTSIVFLFLKKKMKKKKKRKK